MNSGTMKHRLRAGIAAIAGCAALVACGNQDKGPSVFTTLKETAGQIAAQIGSDGKTSATEAVNPEAMAAEALRVNPAPLILVQLEDAGVTQVMAMTGENGTMRTYMNPAMQGVILRNGLLVGTRGILGQDLSTTEIGTETAIRARQPGSGPHTMYIYSGDGRERSMPLKCTVTRGPDRSFDAAGRHWNATAMGESCQWGALKVDNTYLVTATGDIPVSRQWAGPGLGYIAVQTIRP